MKKCKNEKKLRSYDKERNIEVYRADDCKYRNGDCNGTGHDIVHRGLAPKRHEFLDKPSGIAERYGRHVDSQGPALLKKTMMAAPE